MGNVDINTRNLLRNPINCADFLNGYLYDGKQVIAASNLEEMDTVTKLTISSTDDAKESKSNRSKDISVERERDVLKNAVVMMDNNCYYMLIGIENQANIHYAMPVRNMLYNALSYQNQVKQIANSKTDGFKSSDDFLSGIGSDDKLKPVITITIYWGDKPWDGPLTLKEMLEDYDPLLEDMIDDCNINLFSIIDIQNMPEFRTELKDVFTLLKYRNNKIAINNYMQEHDRLLLSVDAQKVISELISMEINQSDKGGTVNMCKAIEEIKNDCRLEGKTEALLENITKLIKKEGRNFYDICDLFDIPIEDREILKAML